MRQNINADIVDSIAKPIVILLLILIFSLRDIDTTSIGYIAFITANLTALILTLILLIRLCRKHRWSKIIHVADKFDLRSLSSAVILTTSGLITYIFFQLDTLLIGAQIGVVEAGAYNMACNFVRLVIFVPLVIVAQMQPSVASSFHSGDFALIKVTVSRALKISMYFASAGVILLALGGRWLLGLVSDDFTAAYPALVLLSLAHLINTALIVVSGALLMCKAQNVVLTSQVFGLLACLPLLLVLIPKLGAVGAATSVLFGLAVNLISLFFLSSRWLIKTRSK